MSRAPISVRIGEGLLASADTVGTATLTIALPPAVFANSPLGLSIQLFGTAPVRAFFRAARAGFRAARAGFGAARAGFRAARAGFGATRAGFRAARAGWLVLCCALPAISADADFFKVFPPSPAIANLPYSGQIDYNETYSPSGSSWAAGLNEAEVFFASLKHTENADNSWEIRIGKGGQLYSIRGLFGESQAPQAQPNAHWIDQIFQLVGVDRALNKSTVNHAYFVHQAGDYLDDPILKSTFYSPMLASDFDGPGKAGYALNWGQQAHIPNVNQAGLLYYERIKDLGSGAIELTYVIYNFAHDPIDYHNTPWGGVRKSVLPVTLASNPDGSFRTIAGLFGQGSLINLNDTGGWIAWTKNAADPLSPTLALVLGRDSTPMPGYQFAPARIQYGTGPPEDDFEVVEATPFIKQTQGTAYYFRAYLVVGTLSNVTSLANRLSPSAARGPAVFTEDMADRKPIYTQTEANGQTVLTTVPQSGQTPAFYTYAEPVGNSLPLFVLRAKDSGRLRLSTNPCELCTAMHTPHGIAYKPYDGTVKYVGFLGFVLPSKFAKSKTLIYQKMLAVVTDRSFLPKNRANRKLRVVVSNGKSHR